MRMRSKAFVWLTVVAVVAGMAAVEARTALAQDDVAPTEDENDFARPGAFAGVGFNWQEQGFQGPFRQEDYGNSWGFDARGGYRFADWFATEAIFEYANKFGPNAPNTVAKDLELITTTVDAKFILPLDRFQPYLEAGVGFLYANDGGGFRNAIENRDIGFAGRIGAGVDLYLTRHVSLFVDNSWTMATQNTEDLYFYSLGGGGRYNF